MGELGAVGGPRSWELGGLFVDLLGVVEKDARTPFRQLQGPCGIVNLLDPEELLVERVLVSVYPQPNESARACAQQLLRVALTGEVELNWAEVRRLADLPSYRILPELKKMVREICDELKVSNPLNPH